jgi:hypothetical protein
MRPSFQASLRGRRVLARLQIDPHARVGVADDERVL